MIAKVHGQWAFVSKHTRRPLAYWRGHGRPPKWWEEKQERRVQYFKRNPTGELGLTTVEALLGVTALGAFGSGLALYSSNQCSPTTMSPEACQYVQKRRDLGSTAMVVGALAGLLMITQMGARAIPAPAK